MTARTRSPGAVPALQPPGLAQHLTRLNPMTYAVEPVRAVVFARLTIPDAARVTLDPGMWWESCEVPVPLQVALVIASAPILCLPRVTLFARTE